VVGGLRLIAKVVREVLVRRVHRQRQPNKAGGDERVSLNEQRLIAAGSVYRSRRGRGLSHEGRCC
jgi:hypothetical protein